MSSQFNTPSFSLHIEGLDPGAHSAPAVVLVQILENAQRAFELIGIHAEGREIKARARIPAATSKRFQLVCHLPQAGSYALPITVGGAHDLLAPEAAHKAFDIFRRLVESVTQRNVDAVNRALPDASIRRRVLEAIKGMAPPAGAAWRLRLHDAANVTFADFDNETVSFVQSTIVPPEEREASTVVTGELTRIDFGARKFTIIYPPNNVELECIYHDAVEELLIERRRDLVQVTGRVVLDEQGNPKRIIDVNDIRDLDLSALTIETVQFEGHVLKANASITLEPSTDDSKQFLCIEHATLGINVFAPTREALLAEIQVQIRMLWAEYALADDAALDAVARQLKRSLLATFSEVGNAA